MANLCCDFACASAGKQRFARVAHPVHPRVRIPRRRRDWTMSRGSWNYLLDYVIRNYQQSFLKHCAHLAVVTYQTMVDIYQAFKTTSSYPGVARVTRLREALSACRHQ